MSRVLTGVKKRQEERPGVCSFIKTQYTTPKRLHSMLIPTIAAGVLYLTSGELWSMLNGKINEVPIENIWLYCIVFAFINIVIYFGFYMKLGHAISFTLFISLFSLLIDLFPI